MGYTQPPSETTGLITNSKGNTWMPTFANIQLAINDLGLLGNESGAAIPENNSWYAPSSVRAWVSLPGGSSYVGNQSITLNPNILLDMKGSRVVVVDDYPGVVMKSASMIKDGTITTTEALGGPATYTNALISVSPKPKIKHRTVTRIEGMHLTGNVSDPGSAVPYKGTGIYLHTTDADAFQDIYSVAATNCVIERCIYAVLLLNEGNANSPSINDNKLLNVRSAGGENGFTIQSTYGKSTDGNIFHNCTVQGDWTWHATYGTSLTGVDITGAWNVFSNLSVWDWTSVVSNGGPSTCVMLDSNTSQCHVQGRGFKSVSYNYLTDSGVDNIIMNNSRGGIELKSSDTFGAAASTADGGLINHNMGHTPLAVIATGTVSHEFVSVTSIGATQFQVSIKKDDGSGGTTQTIYWRAMRSLT